MRDYDPEREKPIGERVGAGGNYGDELEDDDRPVPADVAEPGDDLALLEDSDDDETDDDLERLRAADVTGTFLGCFGPYHGFHPEHGDDGSRPVLDSEGVVCCPMCREYREGER